MFEQIKVETLYLIHHCDLLHEQHFIFIFISFVCSATKSEHNNYTARSIGAPVALLPNSWHSALSAYGPISI